MLDEYRRYGGDIDAWARQDKSNTLSDDEWYLIEDIIQDLIIVKRGCASKNFQSELQNKLKEVVESEKVVSELQKMASESD